MTELERLRAALKWYADAENYRRIHYPHGDGDENAYRRQQSVAFVEMDKGQRARLALEGKDPPVDPYTVRAPEVEARNNAPYAFAIPGVAAAPPASGLLKSLLRVFMR